VSISSPLCPSKRSLERTRLLVAFVPLPDQRTAQMAGETLCLSPPEITRIDANSFGIYNKVITKETRDLSGLC
jgi:hypothetical protein